MATARTITIPSFDFSNFYYPDLLRALIQYKRLNVPEITDESDEEPFIQLLRAYALVGHLNNVLLDVVANESLLPTARLLESVRGHLKLIGVRLKQATPSQVDVVLQFSKVFNTSVNIVPLNSQFGTVGTAEAAQIIFEANESRTIARTDQPTAVLGFTAGKIKLLSNVFDAGDAVSVEGVTFEQAVNWVPGVSIAASLQNLTDAINLNTSTLLAGRVAAINDGVDTISLIPLDKTVEAIAVIVSADAGTTNFEVQNGVFGANKAGAASTPGVLWNLFDNPPKAGDMLYIAHSDVMWDMLDFLFDTFGSGIEFAVEFFDGTMEDAKPDTVTNLGSNLEFDLTTLLGTQDRRGAVVRVMLSSSGASEMCVSKFVGGKNIIRTKGLLGQSTVSTDEQEYTVGSYWNEVSDVTDATGKFAENDKISFSLPQNQSQNWTSATINAIPGYWLRLRVISVSSPANPIVDTMKIHSGKQFLLVKSVQGQTVADAPLGSSNGAENQEYFLTFKPLIDGTLKVEVDDGAGFEQYSSRENFLNSTSISKDYVAETDATDNTKVQFGDGRQGKIPNPGVDNIRAVYRIGADQDGNVGASTVTVNKSGISFVNRIFNPRPAVGWAAKEGSTETDLARLKIEGPASIRVLDRGITPEDDEALAVAYTDTNGSKLVSRAKAIEETFGVKTIELVVVGFGGSILTEVQRTALEEYFNGNKETGIDGKLLANHELTVVNYTPRVIDMTATVTGGNEEQIKNAVTALLNPTATFSDGVTKRWDFGALVPFSVIISAIFENDPVNIKKVDLIAPATDIQLGSRELPLAGTVTINVI